MAVEIIEEPVSALPEYETVPIAFPIKSYFDIEPIDGGLGGLRFVEKAVTPCIKDYDSNENQRPSRWPTRFDMSRWAILSAFNGTQRVGGAALVWKTPSIDLLEGRDDLICLWDLRVHPDYRGKGIGHMLFQRALILARERQCRQLKVETQNTNVPACRFYSRQGCELKAVNGYAYKGLEEIQLLWYRDL